MANRSEPVSRGDPRGAPATSRLLWRRYIPAAAAALTVLAAGSAFQRVFTWDDVVGPLLVSALLGAAAGVAARQALPPPPGLVKEGHAAAPPQAVRGPGFLVALAAIAVGVVLSSAATAAAFASPAARLIGPAVGRGVGALFGGWSRILTTTAPVPPTSDRLPLAAGLVALGTSWAVMAATRRQPGLAALTPAGLVLVIALLLGVGGPGSLAAVAGPPLALAAIYLLTVSRPAGEGLVWMPPGRVVAAVSTAALVLAFSLAAGSHLPFASLRQPVDLRGAVSPPVQLSSTADPLDELPAWQGQRGTVMFTASVDRTWLQSPSDWRLVSLDVYDGAGWSTDAEATRAGQVLSLPPGVSPGLLGPQVRVVVHAGSLPGPWVPTPGVPTAVTPTDADFDPTTSDLVVPGPRPDAVTVTARLAQPSRTALDGAGIPSSTAVAALTAVPACFPASLQTLASQATAGLARPDQQAVALEQELASTGGFRLDAAATPGSSCARLNAFAAARSGTEEQFATAFALMARRAGLPSRLAVGFTPGAVNAALQHTIVTGSDAIVWPEVDLGRLGWVAFAPVPPPGHPASAGAGAGAGATTTLPVAQRGLAQVRQGVASARSANSVPAPPAPGRRPGAAKTGFPWLVAVLLALLAAAAGAVLVRALTRRRRRARRRTAADPATRLLGAWAEFLESMTPFRVPLTSLTPAEVSEQADRVNPAAGAPSRQLATLVDQAVYGGIADDGLAARAWACHDLAVEALAQARPRRLRRRARVSDSAASPPR